MLIIKFIKKRLNNSKQIEIIDYKFKLKFRFINLDYKNLALLKTNKKLEILINFYFTRLKNNR